MKKLTELPSWLSLIEHQKEIASQEMNDWFLKNPTRFNQFSIESSGLLLDYSRNRINEKTISLLIRLAQNTAIISKIEALFRGLPNNTTEKRPALPTALRDKNHTPILVNRENIAPLIAKTQEKMHRFVFEIHQKIWKGVTGKPITHIVNIGIGGSHMGPKMGREALKDFAVSPLRFHFISTVDKTHLNDVWNEIDPECTLFIISSKSFSTLETMTNAHTIYTRMKNKFGHGVLKHHFIAITKAEEKALAFGIPPEQIFPLWDFVGGRYSIWSAIGLPLMLMIGQNHFSDFLCGAYEMDQHFRKTDFSHNMPVLLGLLGVWYLNFFHANAQAIAPYSHRLRYLIPYLQQAEMESNGKSIGLNGKQIEHTTSPIIFGEEGCNAQHTYHQLLHQGTHFIPVDFILINHTEDLQDPHQDLLIASGLSQAQALMQGKTDEEAFHDLIAENYAPDEAKTLAPHRKLPGNRPSNILLLDRLTPKNLGALLALYEHKIFVQGAIWEINSFDQWGVELGKQLLPNILKQVENSGEKTTKMSDLIHYLREKRGLS